MSYFVVFGGELFNKGAQSMVFIVADEIAKRFPKDEIVLVSTRDYGRSEKEKENYKFKIIRSPSLKQKIKMIARVLPFTKDKRTQDYIRYMNNAKGVIDISGYALGSNWGVDRSLAYLSRIMLAKSFKIPIWLFPQSFGPFLYHGIKGIVFSGLAKRYLPYARKIMARENEGKEMLEKTFRLKNVIKTSDMVLQNKGIDEHNIYKKVPDVKKLIVLQSSIAIIPNTKNNTYGSKKTMINAYKIIIDELMAYNKCIYLIYHSSQDYEICKEIKSNYLNNSNVILIEDELSCIEYDQIIGKFDYIIASRYHSIVHAYRRGVPAVIIGWATKYKELAESVNQIEYLFDVREVINEKDLVNIVDKMNTSFHKESKKIYECVQIIQNENVFDLLQKDVER